MPDSREQPHLDLLPQKHHETYEGSTQLLEELPILGRMHLFEAIPNALRADKHMGEYEIHYVLSGTLGFWVGDRTHEVRPGMTFFTQPGELHGGVDAFDQPAIGRHAAGKDDSRLIGAELGLELNVLEPVHAEPLHARRIMVRRLPICQRQVAAYHRGG